MVVECERNYWYAQLIAASEPEGVKRAAADWHELAGRADVYAIINALMRYSDADPDAIRALGALALRSNAEPALRQESERCSTHYSHQGNPARVGYPP